MGVMAIAPSTSGPARTRPPSARAAGDGPGPHGRDRSGPRRALLRLRVREVLRVWDARALASGATLSARLMRELGLAGATQTEWARTTKPTPVAARPADLVERVLTPNGPCCRTVVQVELVTVEWVGLLNNRRLRSTAATPVWRVRARPSRASGGRPPQLPDLNRQGLNDIQFA